MTPKSHDSGYEPTPPSFIAENLHGVARLALSGFTRSTVTMEREEVCMQYQIKQLGLGGILDQAISLMRNHFGLLFGIVGMTFVPFFAVIGFVQYSMAVPGDLQSAQYVNIITGIAGAIFGLTVGPLVNAAMIHAVASLYLSRPISIGQAFSHGSRRYLALLGTSLLMSLAIMGGTLLCIVPGIIFAFWFMQAQHVAVLEGMSGGAAMGRSKVLMAGNYGTGFVLGLIIGIMNAGITFGALLIPQPHAQILASAVAQGITTLLATCSLVVFYFSCRCKVENFDLQVLADAVGADVYAGAQTSEWSETTRGQG